MLRFADTPLPVTAAGRWRHRYTTAAVVVTVLLLSWGGLVTSIDAGLAVPDWPTSFGSFDPLQTGFEDPTDPSARWWHHLPILAEHGHRLLGALVGLFTLGLAFWTWRADPRAWMRRLGGAALVLVIAQGLLGGLRVTEVSLSLAMVHACVAQLFFALLVSMALFTAPGWLRGGSLPPDGPAGERLRLLTTATAAAIYGQIVLGALLRHFGTGVDPLFAGIHITGAFVVVGLALATFVHIRKHVGEARLLQRGAGLLLGAVAFQFTLGVLAFMVLLFETSLAQRSMVQVALNSSHLVVGALLFATSVCLALLAWRHAASARSPVRSSDAVLPHPVPSAGA